MANKKNEAEAMRRMAGGEARPRGTAPAVADFRGYVNLDLSDEQKAAFPAWFDSQDFGPTLSYYASAGVVLSVKVDTKSGGFMASATQKAVGNVNSGLATTARASDALTALERLVYILAILGDDWERTQPRAQGDRW